MLIASAAFSIKCHDHETGQLVHNYAPSLRKNVYIKHITWNKEGTWLAVTPTEGPTILVSIKKTQIKQLHKITSIQEPMCSIFKHDTKKYLSMGTANGSVFTYDLKSESVCQKYPKVDSGVLDLYYCSNDSHLIAGCTNGEIIVFNANTKVKSSKFRIPNSKTLSCMRPHQKKRNLVAGGSQNGLVAIWDLNASKLKYCNKFHNAPVREISFIPNRDDILFSIGMDKKIRFQDINTNVPIIEIHSEEVMTCMDVSYDSTNMIVGTQNGDILVYDIRNIKLPKLSIEKAHNSWIEKISIQTCLSSESDTSIDESKMTILGNDSTLSVIAEEVTHGEIKTNKTQRLSAADSFIDEFGLTDSLNSPINNIIMKRRSSQNYCRKSTSDCSEADSFLDALGFNSPNQVQKTTARSSLGPITKKIDSLLLEKSAAILEQVCTASPILKANETKQSLLIQTVQEISHELLETVQKDFKELESSDHLFVSGQLDYKLTSTPKILVSINEEESKNVEDDNFVVENIQKIVKELIAEEAGMIKQFVEQEISLLKEELKDTIKEVVLNQTALLLENQRVNMWRLTEFHRRLEAEQHMYRVKESIKIEESFIDLAKLITGEVFEEPINLKLSDNLQN